MVSIPFDNYAGAVDIEGRVVRFRRNPVANDRKVRHVKVGDNFLSKETSHDDRNRKRVVHCFVTEVYPYYVVAQHSESDRYVCYTLGDLVMMGLEPSWDGGDIDKELAKDKKAYRSSKTMRGEKTYLRRCDCENTTGK